MRILLVILLIFFCGNLSAQQAALLNIEGIGGNGYEDIFPLINQTSLAGGIIRFQTGSDPGSGNINTQCNITSTDASCVFRKYGSDGTIDWEKCYKYSNDSIATFLDPLPNGEFIVISCRFNSNHEFLIRKEDAFGNILWGSKHYGGSAGDLLVAATPTDDGGYILVGQSNSDDGDVGQHYGDVFNLDIWVLKVDSNGEKLWSTVIGGTDDDIPYNIVPITGGGCYIFGATYSSDFDCITNHGGSDALISKLDDSGNIIWTRCYGGTDNDSYHNYGGWSVGDGQGGILIATDVYSNDGDVSNHNGSADIWLAHIDNNSNVVWSKCYGTPIVETVYSINKATDGTIWLAGRSLNSVWIIHTNGQGDLLGDKFFSTEDMAWANMTLPLENGVMLVGGYYTAPGIPGGDFPETYYGLNDVFLAKIAPWTTSITALEQFTPISVYPNPVTASLFINVNSNSTMVRVNDIRGIEIYRSERFTGELELSTSTWAKGIYYLLAESAAGTRYSKLLVQ